MAGVTAPTFLLVVSHFVFSPPAPVVRWGGGGASGNCTWFRSVWGCVIRLLDIAPLSMASSGAADDETELTDVGGPRPQKLVPARNLQFLEDLQAARALFTDSYLGLSTARITPAPGLRWPAPTWASALIQTPMASSTPAGVATATVAADGARGFAPATAATAATAAPGGENAATSGGRLARSAGTATEMTSSSAQRSDGTGAGSGSVQGQQCSAAQPPIQMSHPERTSPPDLQTPHLVFGQRDGQPASHCVAVNIE